MSDDLVRDLLNVNEKDKGTYGEALRAAAAERITDLEAALRPFAATADKLDAVRVMGSWMTKEYEAAASVVGWKYEDAVRARELLKS